MRWPAAMGKEVLPRPATHPPPAQHPPLLLAEPPPLAIPPRRELERRSEVVEALHRPPSVRKTTC